MMRLSTFKQAVEDNQQECFDLLIPQLQKLDQDSFEDSRRLNTGIDPVNNSECDLPHFTFSALDESVTATIDYISLLRTTRKYIPLTPDHLGYVIANSFDMVSGYALGPMYKEFVTLKLKDLVGPVLDFTKIGESKLQSTVDNIYNGRYADPYISEIYVRVINSRDNGEVIEVRVRFQTSDDQDTMIAGVSEYTRTFFLGKSTRVPSLITPGTMVKGYCNCGKACLKITERPNFPVIQSLMIKYGDFSDDENNKIIRSIVEMFVEMLPGFKLIDKL